MLTEDDPRYANWDQDATAVDDDYGEQDASTVAGELVIAAARIATRFDGVTGTAMEPAAARAATARTSRSSRSPAT